ncbi:MAG: elongation factor G [Bacilli bacterium]|nr:elongation factor G [Bacilli bacterium]
MKEYHAKAIRNVAILGHLGSGKTSLSEALLYIGGAIEKKGEVERKNTVSDYSLEEQTRQTSLSASLIPVEWKEHKINFLDTPGSEEFIGEVENILSVVKGAILLVDATKGVEIGTERCWEEIRKRNLPTIILINKMDKENVKFEPVLESIREKLGKRAVPFCWPLGHSDLFDGFANVVTKKAHIYKDGKMVEEAIYPDKMGKIDELYNDISEAVAETSEELLEKYFSEGVLTEEEIKEGLRIGTLTGDVFPVLVSSALKNIGISTLLNMIVDYMPSPIDLKAKTGKDLKDNEIVRGSTDDAPFSGQVFKTIIDPFVGSISMVKIYSGSLRTGQEIMLSNKEQILKTNQIFSLMGKTQISVDAAYAGDIVAVAKMQDLFTNCTICDKKDPIVFDKVEHPTPTIYVAIQPKNKQDEEKISVALQKLQLEDETFEIKRNPETAQQLVGGQGITHIGYILEKLKNTFKVEVEMTEPKVVYRETIKAKGEAQGRHKKQSGGAGQFGDVWIRFEPCKEDFVFTEEVFGGSVPRNYFPAVEKGLIKILEHGPLAGFPVIGVKATLYDGSYHPVDSNEISFVLAAGLAFKAAVDKIKPTILEPIMNLYITVKSEYLGAVMGDMNKRRGRILGTEDLPGGKTKVIAEVPESEITKYTTELKAMTQASGRFAREFNRYEEVPEHLIKKIIEEYKKQMEQ